MRKRERERERGKERIKEEEKVQEKEREKVSVKEREREEKEKVQSVCVCVREKANFLTPPPHVTVLFMCVRVCCLVLSPTTSLSVTPKTKNTTQPLDTSRS